MNIQDLDCTIRDGGYINDWDFPKTMVKDVYRQPSKAGVDFVEIGFRNINDPKAKHCSAWLTCPEKILEEIKAYPNGAELGVMVDFGKAEAEQFPQASDTVVDMVRVAC